MNKGTLALFVMIFAMASSASSQSKAGAVGGQPRELMTSAVGASRSRVLGNNHTVVSLENKSTAARVNTKALNHVSVTSVAKDSKESVSILRPKTAPPMTSAAVSTSKQIYRVGVGDVLDVRLLDMPTPKSTLFTVLDGGILDYPLLTGSLAVAGMTPEEIAEALQSRIKVLDNPKVSVKVRDYSSHTVIVTGAVLDPGAKFLRREATPLYVVLAEAQPRPEAVKATITRGNAPVLNVDLKDQNSVSVLVLPGDVIKISAAPAEPLAFYYAGSGLNSPGQKSFHRGLTLTQAIIASGGLMRTGGAKVRISRQAADGRLTMTEFNLRQIEDGKTPDPILQEGDRVNVTEDR